MGSNPIFSITSGLIFFYNWKLLRPTFKVFVQPNILVYIDDVPVYIPSSSTVMQACEKVGINIPRFCYHDLLNIAGNCRICLVEIEKSPKPIVSCGLPVLDQIRVYTNTPLVKKAREGVLEFLLLNHPLDCPICDQGGECDLQNQALKYGNTRSRFYHFKRGVEDKGLGPLIKTVITRCIHCTRCVRFAWEIAGIESLGTILRGNQTEIGTYVKKTFNSEVSANIIDLCPVGALTSKVHAFKTRPWEVKHTSSIDLSDSLGSNIFIESKKTRPIRILPRPNNKINNEWLSDKARYTYEGYIKTRLAYPYFVKNNKLYKYTSYLKTKDSIYNFLLTSYNLKIVLGRNLDLETLKKSIIVAKNLGAVIECETPFNIIPTLPAFFQSTIHLTDIEKTDSCLLLGVNPRTEATLANLRLRNRFKNGLFNVLNIGNPNDLTYPSFDLGLQLKHLHALACGKHSLSVIQTKRPIFVYGDTLSRRFDAYSALILSYIYTNTKKSKDWFETLHLPLGSNSIGKSFLGLAKPKLQNCEKRSVTTNYLLGLEDNKLESFEKKDNFIIETTHVNKNLHKVNFALPQISVLEKDGTFINCIGWIQKNSSILRFGIQPLSYLENFCEDFLNNKNQKPKVSFNPLISFNSVSSHCLQKLGQIFKKGKVYTTPFKTIYGDFFRTDRCTCASLTLAKVSANFRKDSWNFKILIDVKA